MAFMPLGSGAGPKSTLPPDHRAADDFDGVLGASADAQPDDQFSDADLEAGNSGLGAQEVVESEGN